MEKLVVKNGHKKGMCYDKIGLCAQTIATTLGLIIKSATMTYIIAKRKRKIFTLTFYGSCISPINLMLETTFFMIHNC